MKNALKKNWSYTFFNVNCRPLESHNTEKYGKCRTNALLSATFLTLKSNIWRRSIPEVAGLGHGPIRPLIGLHKPLPNPHKLPTQQIPLDEIIQRFEQQRSRLIRDARLPAARTVRNLFQTVTDERPQLLGRLFAVPEEPELLALRQLIFVVVAWLGLLHLIAGVVERVVDKAAAGYTPPHSQQAGLQAEGKGGEYRVLQRLVAVPRPSGVAGPPYRPFDAADISLKF